jgi:hypothetical protein
VASSRGNLFVRCASSTSARAVNDREFARPVDAAIVGGRTWCCIHSTRRWANLFQLVHLVAQLVTHTEGDLTTANGTDQKLVVLTQPASLRETRAARASIVGRSISVCSPFFG